MYDLTFLQNFFDGNDLYIYDYQGILNKCGSVTRLIKYKCIFHDLDIGYTYGYTRKAITKWYSAVTSTVIRCRKYEKLGYVIDNVPNDSFISQLNINVVGGNFPF
jgi:hypothetical protein